MCIKKHYPLSNLLDKAHSLLVWLISSGLLCNLPGLLLQ